MNPNNDQPNQLNPNNTPGFVPPPQPPTPGQTPNMGVPIAPTPQVVPAQPAPFPQSPALQPQVIMPGQQFAPPTATPVQQPQSPTGQFMQPLPQPMAAPQSRSSIMSMVGGNKKKIIMIIVGLIGAGVLVTGGLFIYKNLAGGVKYREYTSVSSSGESSSLSGENFSLDVPKQMEEEYKSFASATYIHKNEEKHILAQIDVATQFVGSTSMQETKSKMKTDLSSKNGDVYEAIKTEFSSYSDVEVGAFKSYSTENIKDGLVGEYSYVDKDAKDHNITIKGRVVIGFGEKIIYVLDMRAVKDVWGANGGTWDHIAKSFKIDQ